MDIQGCSTFGSPSRDLVLQGINTRRLPREILCSGVQLGLVPTPSPLLLFSVCPFSLLVRRLLIQSGKHGFLPLPGTVIIQPYIVFLVFRTRLPRLVRSTQRVYVQLGERIQSPQPLLARRSIQHNRIEKSNITQPALRACRAGSLLSSLLCTALRTALCTALRTEIMCGIIFFHIVSSPLPSLAVDIIVELYVMGLITGLIMHLIQVSHPSFTLMIFLLVPAH